MYNITCKKPDTCIMRIYYHTILQRYENILKYIFPATISAYRKIMLSEFNFEWRQNVTYVWFICAFQLVKFIIILISVDGWCEGVVYLMSPGRPTDIGLQLGKACYPCSR